MPKLLELSLDLLLFRELVNFREFFTRQRGFAEGARQSFGHLPLAAVQGPRAVHDGGIGAHVTGTGAGGILSSWEDWEAVTCDIDHLLG